MKKRGLIFEEGDKVAYISGVHGDTLSNPLWEGKHGRIEGTITTIGSSNVAGYRCGVTWDNETSNGYRERDLELVEALTDDGESEDWSIGQLARMGVKIS